MRRLILASLLILAACKPPEPQPGQWDQSLDPYMQELGYTLSNNREVIVLDGVPVWADEICYGRGCFNTNRPLVPAELVEGVRQDYFRAIELARKQYVADFGERIGIEPGVQPPAAPAETDQ